MTALTHPGGNLTGFINLEAGWACRCSAWRARGVRSFFRRRCPATRLFRDPLQQTAIHKRVFNMNRYLLLIVCALVGIFVSSCAPIPHHVVPKGSHSGAPHHLPVHSSPRRVAGVVHHRVLHATDHHHHAQRRAPIATHHRIFNPWNDLPVAPNTPAPLPR